MQKPEIAHEADFDSDEDFRTIRLSQYHRAYSFTETFVIFQPSYRIHLQRISEGTFEKFDMSVEDFNNMCEEWIRYKQDWEAHHGRRFPADFEKIKADILDK